MLPGALLLVGRPAVVGADKAFAPLTAAGSGRCRLAVLDGCSAASALSRRADTASSVEGTPWFLIWFPDYARGEPVGVPVGDVALVVPATVA